MTEIECSDDHASGMECPAHPGAAEATGPLLGQSVEEWRAKHPDLAKKEQ
jgi:hypothetical protein